MKCANYGRFCVLFLFLFELLRWCVELYGMFFMSIGCECGGPYMGEKEGRVGGMESRKNASVGRKRREWEEW